MVVLDVQERLFAWDEFEKPVLIGGFNVEVPLETLGGEAEAIVRKIVEMQAQTMTLWQRLVQDEVVDVEKLMAFRRVFDALFPRRSPGLKVEPAAQIDTVDAKSALEAINDLEIGKRSMDGKGRLFWIKKLFDPEKPISDRAKMSDKTKLKVHFCMEPEFKEQKDIEVNLRSVFTNAESLFSQHLEEQRMSSKRKFEDSESLDLSFLEKSAKRICEMEEEMGCRLPETKLVKLNDDLEVQKQMRDPRLVSRLADILSSEDKFKALEESLDKDAALARFVDLVLNVVGVQQTVQQPDGSNRIESTLYNDLEQLKPSFLQKLHDQEDHQEKASSSGSQ